MSLIAKQLAKAVIKLMNKPGVKTGELFQIINGRHEITVLEDCGIFIIKSGPYKKDKGLI
ncbi:hypothetical protein ACFL18_00245 [Patescibacteria group bacterium]